MNIYKPHKVMTNDDNARSDLEAAKEAEGNSSSSQKNPSTTMCLSWNDLKRNFRCFDLTKTTTQQKALVLLCVAGAIFDPLFFYIPIINEESKCMKSDRKLAAVAISLKSLVDVALLLWRYYPEKWKTERSKSSAASAEAEAAASTTTTSEEKKEISQANSKIMSPRNSKVTSEEKKEISQANSKSMSPRNSKVTGLLIEILSILPLPQAATLAILFIQGSPRSQQAVTLLKFSVLGQFIIRIFRVIPSFQEAITNSFTLLKTRFWIGAGFNLLLFMISSHVLGAFWYLLSVGRMMDCWKSACSRQVGCSVNSLYCGVPIDNKSFLDHYCPIQPATNSSTFNFGIYLDALDSNIVGPTSFPLKLIYCLWWGLRNLSSMGQNLEASAYEWEILFSICISVLGLILFSFFIGNMQAFFQYIINKDLKKMTVKMDKIEKKQRELLKWQPFQWLPQDLQQEIIFCTNDRWLETTKVNIQTMIDYLPEGFHKRFKESIFSKLQKKVKLCQPLDIRAPIVMNCMKPEVFTKGSLVFRNGHPIDKMVFILNGELTKQTVTEGSTLQELRVRDYLGEELLEDIGSRSSTTQSLIKGPLSTADIKTCTEVEAFILDISDLQNLTNQFKDITKNKKSAQSGCKTNEKMTNKKDKIKKKQTELLKWEPFQWLPQDLREEIIFCKNDRWLETTEVNLQTMINYLPEGLNKRCKEGIISNLENKVGLFQALDIRALNRIGHVKPVVFAEGSLVYAKGQPIKHMVFVLNGKLTKQNGSDKSTAQDLPALDFCGEELLLEILRSCSSDKYSSKTPPIWTVDIKACTKVEAFSLDTGLLQTLVNESKDTFEIWLRILELKIAEDEQKKPTPLTKSTSFKESSTVGGTP